jgi:hypothetical protein
MKAIASLPALSDPDMTAMVSYQAPTSAFLSTSGASVRTTIMSMISPGILEESKTIATPLPVRTLSSIGFQVTAAPVLSARKREPMSASLVLTRVTSFSVIPFIASARTADGVRRSWTSFTF